jgi:hypothetical protein
MGGGPPEDNDVLTRGTGGNCFWSAPAGGVTDHGALTGLGDDDHTQYALADGSRGNFEVAGAVAAHAGAADPHTSYQKESEKAAANGYASLDVSTLVPAAQQGTGTPDSTVFLRGDRTWAAPTATADPVTPYAMGTKTISTANFVNMARRLILTGSQIVTIQGTGCLRIN